MTATNSSHTPQQALAALLARHTPNRLLHVGRSTLPAVEAFHLAHPQTRLDHTERVPLPSEFANQRYDLALIVDCLEHLPKPVGLQLLGGIRNLNTNRIAVLVDLEACGWQATDFFGLALQASARFKRDEQTMTLFTYDLLDYKQVPDWLNASCWANPQMFGKYWW